MSEMTRKAEGSAAGRRAMERPLVVGLGTSASELHALHTFLGSVPAGSGTAFVLMMQPDPQQAATRDDAVDAQAARALTELASAARIPVVEAADGTLLEADRIYSVPAHTVVVLEDGVLRLGPKDQPEEQQAAIDRFLYSLARDQRDRSVAVILSGAGSDGALGLKAVSEAGGMTLVQDPATAHEGGMPQSALATGAVDRVLPPAELAAELVAYARHLRESSEGHSDEQLRDQVEAALPTVCEILFQATGHNFRHYKNSTLIRRTLRRVQVLRLGSAREYVERLRADPPEIQQLFKDMLIGVTAFFRDPDAFDVLSRTVIPRLFEERSPDTQVRIWIPGCATGEEAYTMAMVICEHLDRVPLPPEVQIFATDIDEHAISTARQGIYPLGIADELSPERLRRFFVKKGQHYHVSKEIRDLCLFSVHNLINDPPFSKLDLISCRNLLIYLGEHLQRKLIPLFHYALKPGGYLFLGPSEGINNHRELFRPLDSRHRISQRLPTAINPTGLLVERDAAPTSARPPNVPTPSEADTYLIMQRIILDEFAPKSVVVTEEGQIICASGSLEKYLTVSAGVFHNNVVRLAREGLRVGLRTALAEASTACRRVVREGLSVRTEAGVQQILLTVQPMPQMGEMCGLSVVVFQDVGPPLPRDEQPRSMANDDASAIIDQLERELETTRGNLEKTVQELEAANEDLKSSNEELLSMNEELQSANEELETSKEEVQQANEALARANSDLENLLASTQIATLFLDEAGNVRRGTQEITGIYNVLPTDVGRPLSHFTHRARHMPSLPDPEAVREAAKPLVDEVETLEGTWYLRRVLPYRTPLGREEGIVVTFTDVTERKRAEEALRQSEERFRAMAETVPDILFTSQPDGRTDYANPRFYEYTGLPAEAVVSTAWADAVHPEDQGRRQQHWSEAVKTGQAFELSYRLRAADGTYRWFQSRARPIHDQQGQLSKWFGACSDIEELVQTQAALKEADRRKDEFLATLAHELRNPLAPIRNVVQILHVKEPSASEVHLARSIIDRQVEHLTRLVDDLLDVSRITRGAIELRRELVTLAAIIERALETSRPVIEAFRHQLTVTLPVESLVLDADATRLAQVFANLLHNAAKYTPEGGRIELSATISPSTSASGSGSDVTVRIRDNGIGIPQEMLQRVFEMFAQADTSLERAHGGLGIGLTIAKRLVEMHGGTIDATSAGQGQGSDLLVRLPLAPAGTVPREDDQKRGAQPRKSALRVLVVDDNVDSAESLGMLLELTGNEVEMAHDGVAGLEAAQRRRPDLMLLDIGMPGMSGYEVAQRLRAMPEMKGVLLVAMTGWGQEEDRRRSKAAGFDHHLVKPVEPKLLWKIISDLAGHEVALEGF
ncbi:CheR family methyltransferase [Chondromyces apiculatus]|uniref:histidine kinase n=1 Tax=Chondromyces apiculatus DSM 436 TaxID=1192034 RepID=A0A017TGU4_9BACT|nr:CheR family methyltransferase [Chondromyces apiculatus]EYF08498.1 Chemotaxis protein methyltransferase CheR [Chondromyces apiculatus DSM 436]